MAADTGKVVKDAGDLRVVAYPGDGMVLLAMSLADTAVNATDKNLAGFAISRAVRGKAPQPLPNRLSFDVKVTKDTTPAQREWTDSAAAPFQKFRWVDVPPDGFDAPITYRVIAKYFTGQGTDLRDGPAAEITVAPPQIAHARFRVAFTRGYASSQAYADKFNNKDIRPAQKSPDFDTKPYLDQYVWLGADARKRLFEFIDDCIADKTAKVDVFAYDLDEPDVIRAICQIGKQGRLRAVLDNAPLHTKAGAVEIDAAKLIRAAAGDANVKQGHFNRFQHNKVFIKRDAHGNAQKVLFGSMNFSLRGLYVQANNVMVATDATTAGYFAQAFDNAFANNVKATAFAKDKVAAGFNQISARNTPDLPQAAVALSPHSSSTISLGPMSTAIRAAQSSVLFAVMEPSGSGPVLDTLREIAAKPTIFSYGTVETDKGLAVQNAEGAMGEITSYAFLKDKVPAPFKAEWSGGNGMHIHHKFVVVDFNGAKPIVFAGSSNLAAGGEEANGDSLIMIDDPVVASMYAIEAVRLFDHYSFRKYMAAATNVTPLSLWYPGKPNAGPPWWQSSFDKQNIKLRDRYLFADLPLPAGLESVKRVDWAAVDALPGQPTKPTAKPAPSAKPKLASKQASKPASKSKAKPKTKPKPKAKPKTKSKAKPSTRKSSRAKTKKPARKVKASAKRKTARRPAAKRRPAR